MRVIRTKHIPVHGYAAINLFGIIICRRETRITRSLIRHEQIHTRQQVELLFVFFYILYTAEYLIRIIQYRNLKDAYRNLSFEREAYLHMHDTTYLKHRKLYAWLREL